MQYNTVSQKLLTSKLNSTTSEARQPNSEGL